MAFGAAEQAELKMIFELEFFDDGRISSETVRIEGTEGILIRTYDEKGRPTGEVNENSRKALIISMSVFSVVLRML